MNVSEAFFNSRLKGKAHYEKDKFRKNDGFVIMAAMFSYLLLLGTAESAEILDIASIYKAPLSTPEGTGMADIIVKEAFSRIGIKVQIVPAAGATALEKVDKGMYDGDIFRVAVVNQKYPNIVQVPESYYDYEFVAFGKTVNVPMSGYDGLKPYRVATMKGWVETDINVKEDNTKSVVRVASPFDMFSTLVKGETDLVIYNRLMGYDMIKEMGVSDIRALEPPLTIKPVFLYLNKKHQVLVPKLAAAISDMKKDGTISKNCC
ncbi:MAG: amino acid ABC transporter substrate-binding protein [Desulfobacteraceae bacterium]|nr:amino acid ABC transporter substrate-binding protein [Desulfobacteraceae bacterium]